MDCSPPDSSVLGILQARILEWVAISCSRRSPWPRDRTQVSCVSCISRWTLYHCANWTAHIVATYAHKKGALWQGLWRGCHIACLGEWEFPSVAVWYSLHIKFFRWMTQHLINFLAFEMNSDSRIPLQLHWVVDFGSCETPYSTQPSRFGPKSI